VSGVLLTRSRRIVVAVLIGSLFFAQALAARPPRVPRGNPTLVLAGPGGERTLPVSDLVFVHFERVYYQRSAPRAEDPAGHRLDIEDRRRECRCLRLEDWSKVKFNKTRQIEIDYPPGDPVARLRVTERNGKVRELRADSLQGASDSFAPRFAATVDGQQREFPLILAEGEGWPDERLVRLLLQRPKPKAPPPARRSKDRPGR